jgi:tetratricopeptide (TPR) repeat protein
MTKGIKKIAALAVLAAMVLAAFSGCAGSPAADAEDLPLDEAVERSAGDIAGKLPANTRVAIVAFESPHRNLSGYIMDEITGVLVDGNLEVADRNNLEYVYKELNFQMSGDVSDEDAQAIGKFLGVKYVITGQLVDLGGRYRYRLNGINVETAIHESSTRLYVRNDRGFESMYAALQKAPPVVRAAGYGAAPQTAGSFLDRGIAFASRQEYNAAIADFTQALELDPDLASAWMLRGRALYASVSHVTSVGENFSSVRTSSVVGQAVSADRKAVYDRVIADFSQAIRLDPNYATAYSNRGVAYKEKGDHDRAIADYSQAIRLDPNYATAYNNRGNAYSDKGDHDRAIADYSQAIRLDPNDAMAYNNRGIAYSDKGDHDRAIADYSQAIRLDPNYAMAYNNRGIAYRAKGDHDRAIADYNQAIRLDPNDAMTYSNRGVAYRAKGDHDRAIADYSQAIRLDPNDAMAYNNRGVAYYYKKDYRQARADWEQALRLDPNDADARNNLEVLRGMGY